MKYIGAHVSASGGLENAPLNAKAIEASAFALFTKNQRQWKAKDLTDKQIETFQKTMQDTGFTPDMVLPHDSYLINLGNPEPEKRKKSLDAFVQEMQRVEALGLDRLNFHPGAHLNKTDPKNCMKLIAEGIDTALSATKHAYAVIETTAGQGTALGKTFEEIAEIISHVDQKQRVGVCIDTCHIFAAGYDIRTPEAYETTMEAFDSIIGFDLLMGAHLNDAKSDYDSRVDRHNQIGQGNIGLDAFSFLMNDARFNGVPLILETNDPDLWKEEIALLYSLVKA
ncbi:MAG: deoxyribonuclease IV [Spirochaetota bacterium]